MVRLLGPGCPLPAMHYLPVQCNVKTVPTADLTPCHCRFADGRGVPRPYNVPKNPRKCRGGACPSRRRTIDPYNVTLKRYQLSFQVYPTKEYNYELSASEKPQITLL